ncbi:MAG: S8 family serine peptidase [Chitinophagales bacterium]
MKQIYLVAFCFCLFWNGLVAQKLPDQIFLKNGRAATDINLLRKKISAKSLQSIRFQNKYYVLLQFDELPAEVEKKILANRGVHLFDYLHANAFTAEIGDSSFFHEVSNFRVIGLYAQTPDSKISQRIFPGFLESSEKNDLIAVSFFGTLDKSAVAAELVRAGAQIVQTKIQPTHVVFIKSSYPVIQKISHLPFVAYIGKQSSQLVALNYNNRAIHAVDVVSASSGRNLQGTHVAIGVGDNGDPSTHIDFAGRLIVRSSQTPATHGTHTTGTTGGAGIVNVKYKGMAPQSTLISQQFDDILFNAPTLIHDYNMVLTNNSYFQGANGCPGEGEYDALSNYLDEQLTENVSLEHVFAAGNDGSLTCIPYPAFFATVKSGYQSAKNVLTVGAIDNATYGIKAGSSRGPVSDGRIKPEIMAGGQNIISTITNNNYAASSGTSMASPTVTGTIALIYERYRQLHGGADPPASLIKAIACNSADDLGNPGPDYTFGFGMLNARTSVEAMEANHYFAGSMNNGGISNFSINGIPSGTYQLKIMLYWPDAAAAAFVPNALVNDLDLSVLAPDASVHHPMILNNSPAFVNNNAVEGIDHSNNIEQVVINNPPAGNYTLSVSGKSVPIGPQNFVVAYEIINPSVTVEYPFGNNEFVPGETENIRWSAYGGDGNSFTIEYSSDNGSSWNLISNNIPTTSRLYAWTVPVAATNQGLIRVTRNISGYSDVSDFPFTILGQATLTVSNPCPGYAQLNWNSIPSADSYEIMMLKGDSMRSIASSTDSSFLLEGLDKDSSYWLGVRAMNGSTPGRRSISINVVPVGGTCVGSGFNNDFTADSLIVPVTGRQFTSSTLGVKPIVVELRNLGSIPSASTFNISYQVNGGPVVTESSTQILPAGSTYNYSFTQTYDFSAPGKYDIKIWVDYPGDPHHSNDTLLEEIKQLHNDPINLSPSFTEDFESATAQTYLGQIVGLDGLDRFDFNCTANGRARTFVNTGFSRSGKFCATLDQAKYNPAFAADSLIGTFNLSSYSASDQIWLDYYFKRQNFTFNKPGNSVWIRGNDQAQWVFADTIAPDPMGPSVYKQGKSIDVTGILANAAPAQTVSSSFQIKLGEEGIGQASDPNPIAYADFGLSYDDITLTKSSNDVGLVSLLQPNLNNACGFSNAEPISVRVKNYASITLNNISVSYFLNGTLVTETIPALNPLQQMDYVFTQKADLSAFQDYDLSVWVSYAADNYKNNDSLNHFIFHTVPLISSYPYLQGFENDDGNWYTNGINDSWQWGVPTKTIINHAANGSKAWVTSLTGNYNDNELSYLYSPCFDLTGLSKPVLSFSHIFQTEDACTCDAHWVEYSMDNVNWIKLDSITTGTNWYDDSTNKLWRLSNPKWHVSSHDIPVVSPKIRFRIVMSSDQATNFEGVAVDDVHIFDKAPVYDSINVQSLVQPVSGNNWVDFDLNGNRIVSINPNGQDLGNTRVAVYMNPAAVRDTNNQFYLDRNIVIQPEHQPSSYATVRYYFLDTEVNRLINASGCPGCISIHDAYASGLTQYSSSSIQEEDSTLANNVNGLYAFYKPQQDLKIIPYDNGYYAEYIVYSFSEFWINGGGPGKDHALPIVLDSFTAKKVNLTGLLQWIVFAGSAIDSFIIQRSSDAANFVDIGSVQADSNLAAYQFTDSNLLVGLNYYRLKIVVPGGNYQYSPLRTIANVPNNPVTGIYPNPIHNGLLTVNTTSNCNRIELYDVLGRFIRGEDKSGQQNTFSMVNLAQGVYALKIFTDSGNLVTKIVVK